MAIQKSDRFSFGTHLAGAVLGLAALIILLVKSCNSLSLLVISSAYGLSAIFVFTCSALYHGTKQNEDAINAWRKLDHIAIFFMIAGTYTPICYVYLDGWWRWSIIVAQWLLVFSGVFLKIFYLQGPRWLTVAIYVLMGWMALIPLYELLQTMPALSLFLLFGGGVAYTLGALIYALKRPNPLPGVFGFHEIFHLLILLGAGLHFLVVYGAVTGA